MAKDQGATKKKVEAALAKIRPHLQADGGDVELVDVSDGKVTVKLTGACGGCPMAAMTLHRGVERVIKEQVPEVVEVVEV
jgi:Fe-S cluster biogenesis protein NfuA